MKKHVCQVCGYVYDPDSETPSGVAFEDLKKEWTCPECNADKDNFVEM